MTLKQFTQLILSGYLLKWMIFCLVLSVITGSLVALFLWSLDYVTQLRYQHSWLLFFLPLAGILIHLLYHIWGKNAARGNNLIIDEIHMPGGGVPWHMAPLVLVTTLITHLFGGSAGREGTAVQMGGSVASLIDKELKLLPKERSVLLMSGIAAAFGAVFGTPVAGAIFALELPVAGRMNYRALLPCLISAVLSDLVCKHWGIAHTSYRITHLSLAGTSGIDYPLLFKIILAGAAFGAVARLFAWLSHKLRNTFNEYISVKWLVPVTGGTIIILLTLITGTKDYLGLGVNSPDEYAVTILSCFKEGGAGYLSWFWKIVFTVITLSTGFKGGEVTPLFFIGAALGNSIAVICGAPVDLMAGLGFIAVFAGAANTPVACIFMGVELFGGGGILYYALVCFMAYYCSGHQGIYTAQKHTFFKGI